MTPTFLKWLRPWIANYDHPIGDLASEVFHRDRRGRRLGCTPALAGDLTLDRLEEHMARGGQEGYPCAWAHGAGEGVSQNALDTAQAAWAAWRRDVDGTTFTRNAPHDAP